MKSVSVIIPAKNEASSVGKVVAEIRRILPEAELIVVDDGSSDETAEIAREAGATVLSHPRSLGNGAAVKAGARKASGEILVFLDADGQHQARDIPSLLEQLDQGFDMSVAARGLGDQASLGRLAANGIYNLFASLITGHRIPDLTSGFRAVRATLFRRFLFVLPNGFSYPTTITMCFLRAGYPVSFVPVSMKQRKGRSHIRPLRDGLRFLLIIFKVATLYSPLKIFLPTSAAFLSVGLAYYLYTYLSFGRLTNMTVFLLVSAVFVFLIGLVSEQITALTYRDTDQPDRASNRGRQSSQ